MTEDSSNILFYYLLFSPEESDPNVNKPLIIHVGEKVTIDDCPSIYVPQTEEPKDAEKGQKSKQPKKPKETRKIILRVAVDCKRYIASVSLYEDKYFSNFQQSNDSYYYIQATSSFPLEKGSPEFTKQIISSKVLKVPLDSGDDFRFYHQPKRLPKAEITLELYFELIPYKPVPSFGNFNSILYLLFLFSDVVPPLRFYDTSFPLSCSLRQIHETENPVSPLSLISNAFPNAEFDASAIASGLSPSQYHRAIQIFLRNFAAELGLDIDIRTSGIPIQGEFNDAHLVAFIPLFGYTSVVIPEILGENSFVPVMYHLHGFLREDKGRFSVVLCSHEYSAYFDFRDGKLTRINSNPPPPSSLTEKIVALLYVREDFHAQFQMVQPHLPYFAPIQDDLIEEEILCPTKVTHGPKKETENPAKESIEPTKESIEPAKEVHDPKKKNSDAGKKGEYFYFEKQRYKSVVLPDKTAPCVYKYCPKVMLFNMTKGFQLIWYCPNDGRQPAVYNIDSAEVLVGDILSKLFNTKYLTKDRYVLGRVINYRIAEIYNIDQHIRLPINGLSVFKILGESITESSQVFFFGVHFMKRNVKYDRLTHVKDENNVDCFLCQVALPGQDQEKTPTDFDQVLKKLVDIITQFKPFKMISIMNQNNSWVDIAGGDGNLIVSNVKLAKKFYQVAVEIE